MRKVEGSKACPVRLFPSTLDAVADVLRPMGVGAKGERHAGAGEALK